MSKTHGLDLDDALTALGPKDLDLVRYPATALKLRQVVEHPHALIDVARIVGADPALAATVLRTANSVWFRRGDPITALQAAIHRLGETELLRIALAHGLATGMLRAGPLGRLRRHAFHDALMAAAVGQIVAVRLGLDPGLLFVAGLLHDIGKLVAVDFLERFVAEHPAAGARPAYEWWGIVERHHVDIGVRIAERWALPGPLIDCIAHHHHPSPRGPHARAVEALTAVDRLSALLGDRVRLDARMLATLFPLDQSLLVLLARDLERVPSLVASLEAAAPITRDATSYVAPTVIAAPLPVEALPLRVSLASGLAFDCYHVSDEGLVLGSPMPLVEHFLVELTVDAPTAPLTFWAQVSSCVPRASAWLAHTHPMGLGAEPHSLWTQLLETKPWMTKPHDPSTSPPPRPRTT